MLPFMAQDQALKGGISPALPGVLKTCNSGGLRLSY
jgi:hypothetical protein